MRGIRWVVLGSLLVVGAVGCGDGDGAASGATGESGLGGSVMVFAAASLTGAFTELGEAFEQNNTGVSVELNFAGSSALREQILAGAPADVFASANESNMTQVVDGGAADDDPADFATNELQIAVPAGNPGGVTGLADFADGDLLVGLCAEEVPCGEFGRQALDAADVEASVDTNEPDVRSLLTKIEAGELDAGIVYRSDVLSAGDAVEGIAIPEEQNVVATYPIVALAESGNADVAQAFVDLVLSEDGRAILESYGFGPPT